jgi:hypothetical protein
LHFRPQHSYTRTVGTLQAHWISLRAFHGVTVDIPTIEIPESLKNYEPTDLDLLLGAWLNNEILKKMALDTDS